MAWSFKTHQTMNKSKFVPIYSQKYGKLSTQCCLSTIQCLYEVALMLLEFWQLTKVYRDNSYFNSNLRCKNIRHCWHQMHSRRLQFSGNDQFGKATFELWMREFDSETTYVCDYNQHIANAQWSKNCHSSYSILTEILDHPGD